MKLFSCLGSSILLMEFVEQKSKVSTTTEVYEGEKIGQYWCNIKAKGPIHPMYTSTFQSNDILRNDMERFLSYQRQNSKDGSEDRP